MNLLNALALTAFSALATQTAAETALTVTGADGILEFSMEDLKALDQTSYVTINEFVDAPTTFSGPLLRDLVAPMDPSETTTLSLTAINDYQIDVPMSDAVTYDVIVALEKDGAPMSVRENGPLWIIYPMSEHPELQTPLYSSRLIWQLTRIDVQ